MNLGQEEIWIGGNVGTHHCVNPHFLPLCKKRNSPKKKLSIAVRLSIFVNCFFVSVLHFPGFFQCGIRNKTAFGKGRSFEASG